MIINKLKLAVPHQPGIYLFKDEKNTLIYVGKARNLSQRLSYYGRKNLLDKKTGLMIKQTQKISWMTTVSEADALVLEAALIKKHQPKYNRRLKDDKNYQLIEIALEKDEKNPLLDNFAKVSLVRQKTKNKRAVYFGPYPLGSSIRSVLAYLRKIYKFRDCSKSKFRGYQKLGRGCFYYDLNLCAAPCAGLISRHDYRQNINAIKKFLIGGSLKTEAGLRLEMKKLSKNLEFEKAEVTKEKIEILKRLQEIRFSPTDYLENPFLTGETRREEIEDLVVLFNEYSAQKILGRRGFRLEAYDVSHLGGDKATASLVVFVDGEAQKSFYRRFRIQKVKKVNDYAMMAEVLNRRSLHPEWPKPDLILVDGGLGQIAAAKRAVFPLGTPVMGLAKRRERPVINGDYRRSSHHRPALNLLRRIRDESHRFAKTYHQLLRLKEVKTAVYRGE